MSGGPGTRPSIKLTHYPRLALYRRVATRTEPRVAAGSAVNSDTHRSRITSAVIRATAAIRASLVDPESPVRGPSVAPAIRAVPVCGEGAGVAGQAVSVVKRA